jgi:arylsulfatase A-like enzyme
VFFTHAYCASPSCTPSHSTILTGQDIWRLGQGGQLFGTLSAEHPVYPDLLTASSYHVGYMDKGWAPGKVEAGGRNSNQPHFSPSPIPLTALLSAPRKKQISSNDSVAPSTS